MYSFWLVLAKIGHTGEPKRKNLAGLSQVIPASSKWNVSYLLQAGG